MKRFQFSLKALLDTKLIQERELKKELAGIEARLQEERLALDHVLQESVLLREIWLVRMAAGLNVQELQQFNNSFSQLNAQAKARQIQIQKINQEKAHVQDRLIELMTEIKSLETLKEQQYAAYQTATEKEAAKEIDDFISGQRKPALTRIG